MSTRSPQFGRAGSKGRHASAEEANINDHRAKPRSDDVNRRQRLSMVMRDMNRLSAHNKTQGK
ncbi:MAG: hypothetical protein JWP38_3603 [Herbaspirillum sp.]|nr:hypothetical protein [Herbaspirillum sp.]